MTLKIKALLVHLLTASGAVLAMLAMLAAVEEDWSQMFWWLVIALVVDGIDGPLARRYHVKTNFPIYDGVLLDLIIDYLTYVFIPAFALFKSGLLPGWPGWLAIAVITYGSVVYFADTRMKTKDNSFSGFPACWNMFVLVMFAVHPQPPIILGLTVVLTVAMFLPLKFIHPTRTVRWHWLSLPMALAWTVLAGWATWVDFQLHSLGYWGLIVTSVYLIFAGIVQQILPEKR